MKDTLLFSFFTLLCTACASSIVEKNPGFVDSESGYVDLEILYLAEMPIDHHARDFALAGAFSNPGAIYTMQEKQEKQEVEEKGIEEPEEESPVHELSGLIGYTTERGHGGLTLGIDYVYSVTEELGIGGAVEYVSGNIGVGVVTVMGAYSPIEQFYLALGPGVEIDEDEISPLLRLGTGYKIEIGQLSMGPAIYFDWVRKGPDDKEANAFIIAWRIGARF